MPFPRFTIFCLSLGRLLRFAAVKEPVRNWRGGGAAARSHHRSASDRARDAGGVARDRERPAVSHGFRQAAGGRSNLLGAIQGRSDVRAGDVLFVIDPKPFEVALARRKLRWRRSPRAAANAQQQRSVILHSAKLERSRASNSTGAKHREGLCLRLGGGGSRGQRTEIQLGYCTIKSPINAGPAGEWSMPATW